jgi:hypothetical protein
MNRVNQTIINNVLQKGDFSIRGPDRVLVGLPDPCMPVGIRTDGSFINLSLFLCPEPSETEAFCKRTDH